MNTSGEDTKSGVEPEGVVALAKYVKNECKHLDIRGLMTIGMPDFSPRPKCFAVLEVSKPETCDVQFPYCPIKKSPLLQLTCIYQKFQPRSCAMLSVQDSRKAVAMELGVNKEDLELSMGMSGDFEQAIEMGSTNVRVGSTIFGPRIKKTTQ